MVHGPSHHPLAEKIDDPAHKQLALRCLNLGDVGDPLGLWLQRRKVALQVIDDVSGALARPAQASSAFTSRPAIEVVGRHQTSNPIQTRRFTSVGEIFTHARSPDGRFAVFVYLTNALQ